MQAQTIQEKYDELMEKYNILQKEVDTLKKSCCCPAGIICEKHKINTFKPNYTVASQYMEKRKTELLKANPNKKFIKRMDKEEYENHPMIQKETRQRKQRSEKLQKNRHQPPTIIIPKSNENHNIIPTIVSYSPVFEDSQSHNTISLHAEDPIHEDYDQEDEGYELEEKVTEEFVLEETEEQYEVEEKIIIEDKVEEVVENKEEEKVVDTKEEVVENNEEEKIIIEDKEKVVETNEEEDIKKTLFNQYLLKNMKELKDICKSKNFKGLSKYTRKPELIEAMIQCELSSTTQEPVSVHNTRYTKEDLEKMSIKDLKTIAKQWKGHSKFSKKPELIQFILERL